MATPGSRVRTRVDRQERRNTRSASGSGNPQLNIRVSLIYTRLEGVIACQARLLDFSHGNKVSADATPGLGRGHEPGSNRRLPPRTTPLSLSTLSSGGGERSGTAPREALPPPLYPQDLRGAGTPQREAGKITANLRNNLKERLARFAGEHRYRGKK